MTLSAPLTASSSSAAAGAASTGPTGAAPGANPGPSQPTFATTAPAANPVFYRTYSRKTVAGRESWHEVAERNLGGLRKLGNLNEAEVALLRRMQEQQMALPSGRWLWIGGTPGLSRSKTFPAPITAPPPTWSIGKPSL